MSFSSQIVDGGQLQWPIFGTFEELIRRTYYNGRQKKLAII
jgi:hypothetical protein